MILDIKNEVVVFMQHLFVDNVKISLVKININFY